MEKETPKCKDCGQPMVLIGDIGGTKQITRPTYGEDDTVTAFTVVGIKTIELYQCPEDKTIAVY